MFAFSRDVLLGGRGAKYPVGFLCLYRTCFFIPPFLFPSSSPGAAGPATIPHLQELAGLRAKQTLLKAS